MTTKSATVDQTGQLTTDRSRRQLPGAWLMLGVGALALAGLFAILLVVARVPGTEALFPTQDFFRIALIVHVDQSVLIWFLAFAGVLWSLGDTGSPYFGWTAFTVAAGGCRSRQSHSGDEEHDEQREQALGHARPCPPPTRSPPRPAEPGPSCQEQVE